MHINSAAEGRASITHRLNLFLDYAACWLDHVFGDGGDGFLAFLVVWPTYYVDGLVGELGTFGEEEIDCGYFGPAFTRDVFEEGHRLQFEEGGLLEFEVFTVVGSLLRLLGWLLLVDLLLLWLGRLWRGRDYLAVIV